MVKRRAYHELPDQELPAETDDAIRAMIDTAEQDVAERRARGALRPTLPGGEPTVGARETAKRDAAERATSGPH